MVPSQYLITDALMTSVLTLFLFLVRKKSVSVFWLRRFSLASNDKEIKLVGAIDGDIDKVKQMVSCPNGIILTSGPTGSGKTTTLYSVLKSLNDESVNITTIEDPIEIKLEGINQSQINAKAGITFASCMRAILRQDPDIILVGEIRDYETLEIAISAALTGHLVLSTVHTNSAAATVTRLIEMGAKRLPCIFNFIRCNRSTSCKKTL